MHADQVLEAARLAQDAEGVAVSRAVQHQRVLQVLRYIHDHLSEPLDIAVLARVGHLSPTHLARVFRGLTAESIYQHIKRIRLERAALFLRLTDSSVKDVSLACGFDSHEAFTRAFTQAFGCAPRSFRQKVKAPTELPAPLPLHYRTDGPPTDFTPVPDLSRSLAVRIVELPPMRLAFLRNVGPYEEAYSTWAKLLWWAWRRGRLHQNTQFYGLSYDDSLITPDRLQHYDAAIVVEDNFQGDGAILAQTIEGGLFATTTVIGSYEDYDRVWNTFCFQWFPQSGYALGGLYGLDRYNPPQGWSGGPLTLIAAALRELHVDLHMPIAPGPTDRSLLA